MRAAARTTVGTRQSESRIGCTWILPMADEAAVHWITWYVVVEKAGETRLRPYLVVDLERPPQTSETSWQLLMSTYEAPQSQKTNSHL